MENTRPQTLGEKRVRVAFNPSGDDTVNRIKTDAAALIDMCEALKFKGGERADGEVARCFSLAQTAIEEAAMWAVKGATAGK